MSETLWTPTPEQARAARLTRFAERVGVDVTPDADGYAALWQWSVGALEDFWAGVWDEFDVLASRPYDEVLSSRTMPGARWFSGARLNFAEQALRHPPGDLAVVHTGEDGPVTELTYGELRGQVGALQSALQALGVQEGDRVVGYLPNVPAAIVGLLACAGLGAVWSACAPDIGPGSAVDRFGQLDPVVLVASDGYRFGGVDRDRSEAVAALLDGLPTVTGVVHVPLLGGGTGHLGSRRVVVWDDVVAAPQEPVLRQVEAEAPLWVVYSSGTTGLPKGLVHSHVGALLMGLAQCGLQYDVGPGDRFCWYTSTSWIMWNVLVDALLLGATAVLYDGSPTSPSPDRLWQLAEDLRITRLGTSPGYLLACEKAGLHPAREHDLSALRAVGSTGSPLPASSFRWLVEEVGPMPLHVISGGTDFAAALLCDAPWLPVTEGEMSTRGLGLHVEAWDDAGRPLRDEVGELVVLSPMPSMPLGIWGDADGSRYREAYFSAPYPDWPDGVWRHGDWLTLSSRGTAVVHGRSDSTLNRHGVRMGSADVYAAVEALPEVQESLVLGVEQPDGGYWLPLFVRLVPGTELDDALTDRIRTAVREHASPRHVPDEVLAVPAVPHTATGKKLEVPLKRMAQGVPVDKALNLGAVDDPAAVQWFADLFASRG